MLYHQLVSKECYNLTNDTWWKSNCIISQKNWWLESQCATPIVQCLWQNFWIVWFCQIAKLFRADIFIRQNRIAIDRPVLLSASDTMLSSVNDKKQTWTTTFKQQLALFWLSVHSFWYHTYIHIRSKNNNYHYNHSRSIARILNLIKQDFQREWNDMEPIAMIIRTLDVLYIDWCNRYSKY